jgi:thiamine-phosphate diphosphorylase
MAISTGIDLIEKLSVYLVADPDQTERDLVADVAAALAGGVSTVQLRAKTLTDREIFALGERLLALCQPAGAMFLINDRVDIALALGADGVHLGVDDLPVAAARRIGGPELIIGYSPETDAQAAAAGGLGVDYLGVGPVYGTRSKADAGEAIGLELLAGRVGLAGIPVIGIGSITSANAGDVIRTGAVGAAVIGAILRAGDPHAAAQALRNAVDLARIESRVP